MESSATVPLRSALEPRLAWFAACASITLAVVGFLPSSTSRLLAIAGGAALALALAPRFLRHVTPFSAALVTVVAACVSIATVVWLSGLPWDTGISWSQAGKAGRPTAGLFTAASLCFGVGVLGAGRLVLQGGLRRGDLTPRAYRLTEVLPVASCLGFIVVALFPIGADQVFSAAHNLASWAAVGAFWVGMLLTPWLRRVSPALRLSSAAGAVIVFAVWLPNGLRFMRLYAERPISMLLMELVVSPLCLGWFLWLAWEWSGERR